MQKERRQPALQDCPCEQHAHYETTKIQKVDRTFKPGAILPKLFFKAALCADTSPATIGPQGKQAHADDGQNSQHGYDKENAVESEDIKTPPFLTGRFREQVT
jgi:hypothetical protein